MSTPNPFSVVEPWDLVAGGYAAEAAVVMAPYSLRALELAGVPRAPGRDRVLDVATGPGTLALELAPRVAQLTAVDFSSSMIECLRAEASRRGLRTLTALQADGQALPLDDGSFDAAFSMFGWMFFPDRARGLAELRRVLVSGAPLVVSSWAPVSRSPLMQAMFGSLQAADPSMSMPKYDPNGLENPEQLARELRDAGFVDVSVHPHTAELAFDDADALWTRMTRSSAPLVSLRKRLGEAVWQERSEMARAYLARQLGGTRTLSSTALLGYGTRP